MAALVAHGFGLALVPRLAPIPSGPPLARVPLLGQPSPVRRIVACVRRGTEGQPAVAHGLAALCGTAAACARPPGDGTP